MRRNNPGCVVAILPLLLFAYGCAQRGDVEADRADDEAAIRALVAANIAASNARDPVAVQETYIPNGDAWIAGLARVSTRAELVDAEAEFQAIPGFQRFEGELDSIRFISRDAAIAEMSAKTILDRGEFDEETTLVVARTDSGWKIAAWRVMTFDPTLLEILRR